MNFWENLGGYSSLCSEIRELRMIGLFQSWVRGGDSSQKDRMAIFTMKKLQPCKKLLHPTKDAAVRLYIGFYIQVDSTAR